MDDVDEQIRELDRKIKDANSALDSLRKHNCWDAVSNVSDRIAALAQQRCALLARKEESP